MRYRHKCKCTVWRSLNVENIFHVRYLEVTHREIAVEYSWKGFITSVTTTLLCKWKLWSWTSSFLLLTLYTKPSWDLSDWVARRVSGFVFSLLPPFGWMNYYQNTVLFQFSCPRVTEPPLLKTWYHFYFITCSLLLILPIRLLSLTQLLSTHSVLSSPSCLFILLMALSYQFKIQKKGWLPPSCMNCWSSCTSLLMLNAVKYQYPAVISYKSEMGQFGLGETLVPESWYKTCCTLVIWKVFGVFSCFYLPDVAFWKPDVSTIFFCVPAAPFPPAACSNSQFINGFLNLLKYY